MFLVYCHVFLVILIKLSYSERRIIDGKAVSVDKPYVAYLVRAPPSPQKYDAWLCGGAIVSPWFIITSAACVEDVQHMYAVAGYKNYVRTEELNSNACTSKTKKKVVFTCVPKAYELDYEKLSKWSYIDIAIVKVESEYNFNDDVYTSACSYKPAIIAVNYEPKYQVPGTDGLVYGWGHKEVWRKPDDKHNYNQESLHYSQQLLIEKQICKDAYKGLDMDPVIDKYMVCSMEGGNIDDKGDSIGNKPVLINGCATRQQKLMGIIGVSCEEQDRYWSDQTRRNGSQYFSYGNTRKNGICQNDHGGPLVTWVGAREVLIGVASVFRVDNQSRCVGPFLFTSTQCNGAFLDCILSSAQSRRNDICDQPASLKGFDVIKRRISWIDHPEGPAENEVNSQQQVRPQIPLWNYAHGRNQYNMKPYG